MLRRSTWIVLGIFVLLIVGLFLWQRYGGTQEPLEPTATIPVTEMVFDFNNRTITRFSISGEEGDAISFELNPDNNTWIVVDQPIELADSAQIEAVTGDLTFLTVNTPLPAQPPLDAMGLKNPSYIITIKLSDGEEVVLNIGNQTATGTGYYVMVNKNPAVVVAKAALDSVINLLNNPPLVATSTPTVTSTFETTEEQVETVTPTP